MDSRTDNEDAEEFSAYSLNTLPGKYKSEEVLLYGIEPDSRYVTIDFNNTKDKKDEARMSVEMAVGNCVRSSSQELRSFASQYMDGSITRDQVVQFSEQFNSDIRATMDWREPFDIPDYLDQNGDNILDEFQDLDKDKSPDLEPERD